MAKESPYQASKWLHIQALLDEVECEELLTSLSPFYLYQMGIVGGGGIPIKEFLSIYTDYVNELKEGRIPNRDEYGSFFSSAMTKEVDCLYAAELPNQKHIVRITRPVVQLQEHTITFSPMEKKFRSMVHGKDSMTWGLQFSFPQLYENVRKGEIEYPLKDRNNENATLFRSLQKWMRRYTLPTPFIVQKEQINYPARIGKGCLSWINRHPKLIVQEIMVGTNI